jgi:hypothetical protein
MQDMHMSHTRLTRHLGSSVSGRDKIMLDLWLVPSLGKQTSDLFACAVTSQASSLQWNLAAVSDSQPKHLDSIVTGRFDFRQLTSLRSRTM